MENIMLVSVLVNGVSVEVSAKTYTFPKKGNAEEGFSLTLCGDATKVAKTGGGKYPRYTYFMDGEVSYYLPKNIEPDVGTDIIVVGRTEETPEVAKAAGRVAKIRPTKKSVKLSVDDVFEMPPNPYTA